jgi:uncharacterized membrane protein
MSVALITSLLAWLQSPHVIFPANPGLNELMALRWLHFIFGIIWIGLLYFFNLVGFPTMKALEPSTRVKVFPVLMSRAMSWFRWSALITALVGLRYFFTMLSADARNSGDPSLALRWFAWWLLVWVVAYAGVYFFQLPATGIQNSVAVRVLGIAVVVAAASWIALALQGGQSVSNGHLAISVGGGLGFIMLLNTWGVVWRAQKRLIAWTRAAAEQGTPMPSEADRLMRWVFLTARTSLWLSFPMLFLMGASSHYPFLTLTLR